MPSKLDEIRRRAEEAARQIDQKYDIKTKIDRTTRAANESIRKGVEAASSSIESAREEINRVDREHKVTERVTDTARRTASKAEDLFDRSGVKKKAGEVVDDAKSAASDLYGEARRYYENATGAARAGAEAARASASVVKAVKSAREWVKKNPRKTAIVSLGFMAGARAGAAFSSLDVALLGAGGAGNWLFHSALVPYGLRKLSEKYEAYLARQEKLIQEGKLSEAELERVKFERTVAKYVGAPLLGAFSVAAGAGLVYEAFTGAVVTGFPINLVIGGNPMLSSIWFFANGLVCFHNGYKFFMMALGDQEDVAQVVRDIKGLLPANV
jgi:hypothetical protein